MAFIQICQQPRPRLTDSRQQVEATADRLKTTAEATADRLKTAAEVMTDRLKTAAEATADRLRTVMTDSPDETGRAGLWRRCRPPDTTRPTRGSPG